MENTLKLGAKSERDIFYYRQRHKNRVFQSLTAFFAEEAERRGISKRDIADCLNRDPAQITRWLSSPSNLTLDTISDLLLSLDAEMDHSICKFDDQPAPNFVHPFIEQILDLGWDKPKAIPKKVTPAYGSAELGEVEYSW